MANTHSLDLESASSQYASKATPSGIDFDSTGFTVELWLKPESLAGTIPLAKGAGGNANEYFFYLDGSGYIKFGGYNTSNAEQSSGNSTTALQTGVWTHVAGRYTGTAFQIVINGTQENTTNSSGTLKTNQGTFYLGQQNGGNNFDGLVDELRIWSASVADATILANMSKHVSPSATDLIGYWKLNNSYDDETSNNNDLTSSGSPTFSTDVPFIDASTGALFFAQY